MSVCNSLLPMLKISVVIGDVRAEVVLASTFCTNVPYYVICIKCKKIVDPDLDSLDDMKKEVANETNFKILNHRLDFFGICSNCLAKQQ